MFEMLISSAYMARASANKKPDVTGITFVRELGGIREYRLEKNGLRILLAPDHSVPVVGSMITYHVGSRNEAIGYTGATHLLEHLMYKESENFNEANGKPLKFHLQDRGSYLNATTFLDRTNYFFVMPKHLLTEAVAIEGDRMRNLWLTEKDRQDEMPIVRNEFERGENLPIEALDKQIWAIAYQAHPYHHSTIGWRSDIENVSIERLKEFYDEFYWPDNATVTVVGDIDIDETLRIIVKEFGRIPKKTTPYPRMYTEEPVQQGERRVIVKRAGNNLVGIAHKVPSALHEDMPALLVLSTLLDDGKTSRLYRALVDTALASDVSVATYELHDPGLMTTYASLTAGVTHEKVEKVIRDVYSTLKTEKVSTAELTKIKRLIRTRLAQRRDGHYQFLMGINESIAAGDWAYFVRIADDLMKVTAADVRRVAQTYLVDDQMTVGYFVNTAN